MTTQAQRDANRRYRMRNKERCNAINAKAYRTIYAKNPEAQRQRARTHYQNNRNYKGDISNMGKVLYRLFELA